MSSRVATPCCSPTRLHSVAASRIRRGRSSSPTSVAKVCSAGPPVARRRRSVSRSASAPGNRSATASATTTSTQPSTSASSVSSRVSAACCCGVVCGCNSPEDDIASSMLAGLLGSIWLANCSMADMSTVMPRANSSTVSSSRWRNHGACVNNRWCAASRAARNTSTSLFGLPLGPDATSALLPANIEKFTSGLDRPNSEVLVFLAAREAAHQRLFTHAPWLRQRLLDTVEEFARGITVDMSAIEQLASQIDPSNPASIEEAMSSSGLLQPQTTPQQQAALTRLETLLALVEGWVDVVVADAVADRLPGADALRETLRRRRATGGPAEQTFATLVGLELRPRRMRDAATLWSLVGEQHGVATRDDIWSHPDFLPTSEDLDDPAAFAQRLDERNELNFDPITELEKARQSSEQHGAEQDEATSRDPTPDQASNQDSDESDGNSGEHGRS